jgi:hypothetical protein
LPIINEQLKDFKEDKNLVMYCTGGIRCEKHRLTLNTKVSRMFSAGRWYYQLRQANKRKKI